MPLSLMPDYLLREFDNDGKMLSGGTIYFYESGTMVPKTVYSTALGDIPLGTSVTLSASGSAVIFLGEGAYRILIRDQFGVQITEPVDGIVGSSAGFAVGSNANIAIVKTYNDLRALTSNPDVVYVCGRTSEGDGGQGLFQLIPASILNDDDGIVLTAMSGSNVYKRVFDAAINPEWYGVKYGISLDQAIYLQAALAGSVQFDFPVMTSGSIYLSANITVPNGAGIYCSTDGYFVSGGTITMTFASGSHFDAIGTSFGSGIYPVFAAGVAESIKLSWMGESDTIKWAKLVGSSTAPYTIYSDINTTITSDLTVPLNFSLDFISGSKITFGGFVNLSIARFIYSGKSQVFQYNALSYVGSVSIGADKIFIEWFGGVSGGDANINSIAFKAIAMNGYWDLLINSNYTITNTTGYTTNHELRINGNGSTFTLNQHINLGGAGIGGLWMTNVTYSASATGSITCVTFIAKDSNIWGTINCYTNLIYDSIVGNLDNISSAINSKFFQYTGSINGNCDSCEFTLYGTVAITNSMEFSICKFIKNEDLQLPAFTAGVNPQIVKFNGCNFNIDGALFYSENTLLVVDLISCTDSDNWAKGIHNGFATANLVGCNCRGNSTATTVDGTGCQLFNDNIALRDPGMRIDIPSHVITSAITGWYGIGLGSLTSNGLALILGTSTVFGTTPWSLDTLRFAGFGSGLTSSIALMDQIWRYGGQATVKVEYPTGVAPDPYVKLCVAFVCPGIPVGLGMTDHHFFGKSTSVGLANITAAKLKTYVNVWGGQSKLSTPGLGGPYDCVDEWGDVGNSVVAGGVIPNLCRVVIYNEGSGTVPAGTKITLDVGAYMPTTDQYVKYWPVTPFETVSGTAFQSGGGGGLVGPGLWKTPYVFRSGDANGVEIAKVRPDYGTGTLSPTPINLPVTVWANGTTLNGSYS